MSRTILFVSRTRPEMTYEEDWALQARYVLTYFALRPFYWNRPLLDECTTTKLK